MSYPAWSTSHIPNPSYPAHPTPITSTQDSPTASFVHVDIPPTAWPPTLTISPSANGSRVWSMDILSELMEASRKPVAPTREARGRELASESHILGGYEPKEGVLNDLGRTLAHSSSLSRRPSATRSDDTFVNLDHITFPKDGLARDHRLARERASEHMRRSTSSIHSRQLGQREIQVDHVPSRGCHETFQERKERRRRERSRLWRRVCDVRRWLRWLFTKEAFHIGIITLVVLDLLLVFAELIVALLTAGCTTELEFELILDVIALRHEALDPSNFACSLAPSPGRERLEIGLFATNLAFLSIFELEVLMSIFAFGPLRYLSSWLSVLDGVIVSTTLGLDISFHQSKQKAGHSAAALVILRFWKVIRAVHAIAHTLELHHQNSLRLKKQALDALLREKVAENIRLCFVRQQLMWETGHDVDPEHIEAEVREKMTVWEERRQLEEHPEESS